MDGWISILAGKSPVGTYADENGESKTYNVPITVNRAADVGLDGEHSGRIAGTGTDLEYRIC